MYVISCKADEICSEIPKISKWIGKIHKHFLKKEVDMSNIDISFSYGFFVPKGDKNKFYEDQSNLLFEDRLKLELSKLRIDINIKIDKFNMSNRLDSDIIPTAIKQIVTELTKVKMTLEGEFHQIQSVIDSIPEIDTSIVSYKVLKNDSIETVEEKNNLDIDFILDKINKSGIESLSEDEKQFLDNFSNGF